MTESDNPGPFSDAELLAATVVADCSTIIAAAERLGMSKSKAYKISSTPAYRRARITRLIERSDEIAQVAIDAERAALATLVAMMSHEDANIAVAAAKGVLGHHQRVSASLDRQLALVRMDERLADLQEDPLSLIASRSRQTAPSKN